MMAFPNYVQQIRDPVQRLDHTFAFHTLQFLKAKRQFERPFRATKYVDAPQFGLFSLCMILLVVNSVLSDARRNPEGKFCQLDS
jgi:hypothetical protein